MMIKIRRLCVPAAAVSVLMVGLSATSASADAYKTGYQKCSSSSLRVQVTASGYDDITVTAAGKRGYAERKPGQYWAKATVTTTTPATSWQASASYLLGPISAGCIGYY